VKTPLYESDITRFLRDFLARHPEECEVQRSGRADWWDKDPQARTPSSLARHAPRAGGAEYTFLPLSEKE